MYCNDIFRLNKQTYEFVKTIYLILLPVCLDRVHFLSICDKIVYRNVGFPRMGKPMIVLQIPKLVLGVGVHISKLGEDERCLFKGALFQGLEGYSRDLGFDQNMVWESGKR